jgi:hypothetical protein
MEDNTTNLCQTCIFWELYFKNSICPSVTPKLKYLQIHEWNSIYIVTAELVPEKKSRPMLKFNGHPQNMYKQFTTLRFEVLTSVVLKVAIFWDIAPCSPHIFLLERLNLFAICNNTFSKWWEG